MGKSIYCFIQKFQKGIISRKELLREISSFILKIPVSKGYYEEDVRYDFYAYVISKIEKIISNYKVREEIAFESWFFLVLSRQFYNFINKKLKHKNDILNNQELFYSIADIFEDYGCKNQNEEDKSPNYDFSFLTEKEKKVLAFKYGINTVENNYEETAKIILDKIEKKKKIEEKIYDKYIKLITVQKKINRTCDENEIINLKNKEIKIKKYKRRLEDIFKSYNIYPSNNWVGGKLGISEGTVGAYLFKIKNKIIKRNFSEFDYNVL